MCVCIVLSSTTSTRRHGDQRKCKERDRSTRVYNLFLSIVSPIFVPNAIYHIFPGIKCHTLVTFFRFIFHSSFACGFRMRLHKEEWKTKRWRACIQASCVRLSSIHLFHSICKWTPMCTLTYSNASFEYNEMMCAYPALVGIKLHTNAYSISHAIEI